MKYKYYLRDTKSPRKLEKDCLKHQLEFVPEESLSGYATQFLFYRNPVTVRNLNVT
jgi:hypothetical protein